MSDIFTTTKRGKWTPEEDAALRLAVRIYEGKQWKAVAEMVGGRSAIQCLHRWSKILKPGLVKGPWKPHEDELLKDWVEKNGEASWSNCILEIPGRSGKQCRERWLNILSPLVRKGPWTPDEDAEIFKMYQLYGPKWTLISKFIEGRTENSIKNRFYSILRKIKMNDALSTEEKISLEGFNMNLENAEAEKLLSQVKNLENVLVNTRDEIINLESSLGNPESEVEIVFTKGVPDFQTSNE